MQEWLKDKKNLPIVVALAVFVLLGAGGLIALELGAFTPQQASVPPQAASPIPSGPPVGPGGPPLGAPPSSALPAGRPSRSRPGLPAGLPQSAPAGGAAVAAAPKSDIVNPLVGPDPFKIPGGAQKLAKVQNALAGSKPALRNLIGPLDLFRIRPPAAPALPSIPNAPGQNEGNPGANIRLSGIINGPDGSNAIVEVGGQSQQVKPGDSLPDGTNVQSIQATTITLRSPGGSVFNLPISAGAPDGGTPFNGPSPYNPGGYNPGGYNPGGYNPGGGYGGGNPGGYNGPPQFNPNG